MGVIAKLSAFTLGTATSLFLLSPVPHDDIWVRAAIAEDAINDIRADRGLPARAASVQAPVGPTHLSYWVNVPGPEQIRASIKSAWNQAVLSVHGGASNMLASEQADSSEHSS